MPSATSPKLRSPWVEFLSEVNRSEANRHDWTLEMWIAAYFTRGEWPGRLRQRAEVRLAAA